MKQLFFGILCLGLLFFLGCSAKTLPVAPREEKKIEKKEPAKKTAPKWSRVIVAEVFEGKTFGDVFKRERGLPEQIYKIKGKKQLVFFQGDGVYNIYYVDYPHLKSMKQYSIKELSQMEKNGEYPQKIIDELAQ